jgi:hypothetical protein
MVIGEILAYVEALIACDLPPDELAARIKAKLPAAHTGTLDDLIGVAPPAKLPAVIATFLKGLAKVEKADAKRKRDRENVATKRAASPRRGTATSATRATSATSRHGDPSPAYTSPPVSEPKRVLKSISTYPLPTDFKLAPSDIEVAKSEGWDQQKIDRQFSRFCDHHRASGTRKADWNAMWRLWVTNPLQMEQPSLPLRPPLTAIQGSQNEHRPRANQHSSGAGGLARVAYEFGQRATDGNHADSA